MFEEFYEMYEPEEQEVFALINRLSLIHISRSDYIGKRRSYRLIPETNLEIIYLTMNCDYDYRLPPKVVGNVVFRHVGTVCSEKGIWVSKKWIPGYLIEAWFEP